VTFALAVGLPQPAATNAKRKQRNDGRETSESIPEHGPGDAVAGQSRVRDRDAGPDPDAAHGNAISASWVPLGW
jgi:hypothetical protein